MNTASPMFPNHITYQSTPSEIGASSFFKDAINTSPVPMEVGVESTYIALSTQPAEFKNLGGSRTLQNILPPVTEDKMLNRWKVAGQQEELDDDDLPKDPRRRRVLERNRIAANKCRLRKRDEALALASREETIEDQNRYLMTCLDFLTVENYIANEAQKCVDRLVACSTAFDTYGNSLSPCDRSPSSASTAEELNTQSLNGGCFLLTLKISSQQESGTSEVTGVIFDIIGLGPFQAATMPPNSMAFT
ncbi:hypothetical protein BKA60DRAFT_602313 [Fusarium oxysporum]|nr:hypothetical protein BKA60DRAFT_602313 [Fusarium oxysporum]